MGFRLSAQAIYWFERASEIIAAALFATLVVGLMAKAEHRLSLQLPLATIEDQYAMSWSIDQSQSSQASSLVANSQR